MNLTLATPAHAGAREQAQALTAGLPEDLSDATVTVNCAALKVSTPSFFDELVKVVLIDRCAGVLCLVDATTRNETHARNAARNRSVDSRLRVQLRSSLGA